MIVNITISRNGTIEYQGRSLTNTPIETAHEHLREFEISQIEETGLDNSIASLPDVHDDDDIELIEDEQP